MLRFSKIEIEGFGSIVNPLTYRLDAHPLTIIRGRNGGGKTSVLMALVWVLFGVLLKNKGQVNTWPHLRTPGYKGTKVTIYGKKGKREFSITRRSDYGGKVDGAIS